MLANMLLLALVLVPCGVDGSFTFNQDRTKMFLYPTVWEESEALEWDSTWGAGLKPGEFFDAGMPLPALVQLVKSRPDLVSEGNVLVPGCGRGYAVEALSTESRHVIGIDIAPTAVAAAKKYLQQRNITGTWAVRTDSFFDFASREANQGYFDIVYDYTFLSVIPPKWRSDWGHGVSSLLAPGGIALVALFPIGSWTGGPPWTMDVGGVGKILEKEGLERIYHSALEDRDVHKGREGMTAIAAWRKPIGRNSQSEL